MADRIHGAARWRAIGATLAVWSVLVLGSRDASAGAYVPLSQLVERHGLSERFEPISGRRVLEAKGVRVVLAPGLRQALVGGKPVPLGGDVICRGGDLLVPAGGAAAISERLARALPAAESTPERTPAAAPSSAPASAASPRVEARRLVPPAGRRGVIVIDPGHGGKHTGARGPSGVYEKQINLAVAKAVAQRLRARGWQVRMTRTSDRELSPNLNRDLDARVAVANGAGARLFVSIHANFTRDRSVRGYEIYHYRGSRDGKLLAEAIHTAFKRSVPDRDRGVKSAGFRVIKRARMPAVLVELGFVSNRESERRLRDPAYQGRLADAIVAGIEAYAARSR